MNAESIPKIALCQKPDPCVLYRAVELWGEGGRFTSGAVDYACSESLLKFDDPAVITSRIQMLPVIL